MSVDAFCLKKFMAFDNTGWIQLRRLNLLLGRNSSGKTAIIRALRLMKQSLLATNSHQPLTFNAPGGVDIGDFDAMLHHEQTLPETEQTQAESVGEKQDDEAKYWSEPVTFGFRGTMTARSLPDGEQAKWSSLTQALGIDADADQLLFEVNASYSWYTKEERRIRLRKLEVCHHHRETPNEPVPIYVFDPRQEPEEVYSSSLTESLPDRKKLLILKNQESFLPDLAAEDAVAEWIEAERTAIEGLSLFWGACKKEITDFLMSIQYVGPARPRPARSYVITDEIYHQAEQEGSSFFLDYLLAALPEENYQKLSHWLKTMNLGATIYPRDLLERRIGSLRGVVELKIDERGLGEVTDLRNLTDVGYGASQVIPVIVACLSAKEDALVLIEQPELHLHPEAQANIADLLIDSINERRPEYWAESLRQGLSRQEWRERAEEIRKEAEARGRPVSRRFLVETHSEHLLLRSQRRVAETAFDQAQSEKGDRPSNPGFALNHANIGVLFVTRANGASSVESIQTKKDGDLAKPSKEFQDFFRYDYDEVVRLDEMIAKLKKMESEL